MLLLAAADADADADADAADTAAIPERVNLAFLRPLARPHLLRLLLL